jgi:CRISPR-associated protein Cas2
MMVLVLSACPAGLRGHLTRWLLEISPGVFVGNVTRRVRELMWEETVANIHGGRAILVWQSNTEQRLSFLVHGHQWEPTDFEGLTLMMRPHKEAPVEDRAGTSKAARFRRFGYKR